MGFGNKSHCWYGGLPELAVFGEKRKLTLSLGVAGHAFGYNSGPKDNAGNNPTIVFLEKVREINRNEIEHCEPEINLRSANGPSTLLLLSHSVLSSCQSSSSTGEYSKARCSRY